MANFLVVAVFAFTFCIFLLKWFKYRITSIQKEFGQSENYFENKIKGMKGTFWLDAIPGPKPFPLQFIGNIFQLQPIKQSTRKFFQWCAQYPTCFKFIAFNQKFIIFNKAELVHALLKSTNIGHANKSFMYDCLKPYITSGLIPANDQMWRYHRKILNRSMNYQELRGYVNMVNHHSRCLITKLDKLFQDNQPHQINVLLNCSFIAIICEILTGSDAVIDEADVVQYHYNFQEWKATVIRRLMKPWLFVEFLWKLHPMSREYFANIAKLDGFGQKIMEVHKSAYQSNSRNNNDEDPDVIPPYTCMLSELRMAEVPEAQILQEINSMLLAGHETVATTMHFFCFRMALEPDIQENCRKEVDDVFENALLCTRKENGEQCVKYEALAELKYLERCILEVLRLYPPVFIYLRQLQAPLPLKINDTAMELPPGANAVVVPAAIHMNPKYFPDPQKFNPDRFLPEESVKRPVGAYIPFSSGPRGCLGMKFAIIELKIMAAFILRNFEIKTTDKLKEIPIIPYITLTPKRDYFFKLTRRTK